MKLRNKNTGEIVEFRYLQSDYVAPLVMTIKSKDGLEMEEFASLHHLYSEWEDAPEEPKEYYFIRDDGSGIGYSPIGNSTVAKRREAIGNYFETKEEAELAVRKLKAWKRLKDNGFKFQFWTSSYSGDNISFFIDWINTDSKKEIEKDLDLLFGGEE